jgi:hypothetical protein
MPGINGREIGSTLVLVLGAVVVAAMVATSYLMFTDNLRERAARRLDRERRQITAEQGILEIEKQIRDELLRSASVDLRKHDQAVVLDGRSLSFNARLDQGGEILQVEPLLLSPAASLATLGNEDPFGAAKARVQLVNLTGVSEGTSGGQQRLSDVQLTATPQIAIREIPISQFTVYSAGNSFALVSTSFGPQIGRVFSQSNITMAGSFSSAYPIVSGGQVNFNKAQNGSVRVADSNSADGSIGLSTDSGTTVSGVSYEFLANARTLLDSRIITNDVLPVACAPPDQIYDVASAGSLNFTFLKAQCDLVIVARILGTPNASTGFQVVPISKTGTSTSALVYAPSSRRGTSPVQQTVAFVAYPQKNNPAQILLAFDYRRLPSGFSGSVYLAAQDSMGKPIKNATVVVRGAQTLSRPLSIVTPHTVVIAGDFNQTAGDAPACSIITAEDVQTQAADWANDSLGAY